LKHGKVEFSDQKYARGRERIQPFKSEMLRLITAKAGGRILDIGCGTGVVSSVLKQANWNVIGLDISLEGVKKYCQAGFVGLLANVEYNLPFKDNIFDAVWISEVIEHIVEYQKLIKEIYRILKPNGCLYLTTPNSAFYGYRLMYLLGKSPSELQHPYHVRFFNPKYLSTIIEANGFKVEKRLGQNIYMIMPSFLIKTFDRLGETFSRIIMKIFACLGFKKVEGLIHGDKYLWYKFSHFFNGLFSSVIMLIARRESS
jgi:2-polyprenyl-3-methyl-5-hydroxy-6-metoxy-1,4-benzoquinol methylase